MEAFELFACDDEDGAVSAIVTTPRPRQPYQLVTPERDRAMAEFAARYDLRVRWEGMIADVADNPRRLFPLAHDVTRDARDRATRGFDYAATFRVACWVLTGRVAFDVRDAGLLAA